MRFHVTFLVFDSVIDPPKVASVRESAAATFKALSADKRISSTGYFVGRRGGYFVIELNDAAEVMPLVGPLLDGFSVTVAPLADWAVVQQMFDKQKLGGQASAA